jgi:hypothetical protein
MSLLVKDCADTAAANGTVRVHSDAFELRVGGAWTGVGGGGGSKTVSRKTDTYAVQAADANGTVFEMNAAAAKEFTLEAAPADNRNLTFKSMGAGVVTINRNGINIDGVAADLYLGQYDSVELIYNATDKWMII